MLGRNAQALAGARARDTLTRQALLVAGAVTGIGALAASFPPGYLVAGLLVGFAFRPEADRYYLEGFADGLVAVTVDPAAAAPDGRGDDRGLDPVRGGAGEPARWAGGAAEDAPRPPSRRFSPVGGAEPQLDLASAAGILSADRYTRPPVDDEGNPTAVRTVAGPRAIAPAVPVGPVVRIVEDRPAAGPEAGRGVGKSTSLKDTMMGKAW